MTNWKAIAIYSIILIFILTFGMGSLIELQKHQIKQQQTDFEQYKENNQIYQDYGFSPEKNHEDLWYNKTHFYATNLKEIVYSTHWINTETDTGFDINCIIHENRCEIRTNNSTCYKECQQTHPHNWYNKNICNCTTTYTIQAEQTTKEMY